MAHEIGEREVARLCGCAKQPRPPAIRRFFNSLPQETREELENVLDSYRLWGNEVCSALDIHVGLGAAREPGSHAGRSASRRCARCIRPRRPRSLPGQRERVRQGAEGHDR
jgi:hypothetical protein